MLKTLQFLPIIHTRCRFTVSNTCRTYSSSRRDTQAQWPEKFNIVEGSKSDFTFKLVCNGAFSKGQVLVDFSCPKYFQHTDKKAYSTLQVDTNKHIELESELLYMNHSCDPSTFFDTEHFKLVALKSLKKGDELTFFYPSTEWDMDQAFNCWCKGGKSIPCLHTIKGAKYLSQAELESHSPISKHIKELLKQRDTSFIVK